MSRRQLKVLPLALIIFSYASTAKAAIDITATGFGSAFYGQTFNNDLRPASFADTKANFTNFSLIGTDLSAKLGNGFSAATEIIAQGNVTNQSSYTVFAQWALVSYTASEGTVIKMGRQRYPLWTASEYINNHHELPFRIMPSLVYAIAPFSSYDGLSVTHSYDVGGGKLGFSIFGGAPVLDTALTSAVTVTLQNLYGARVGYEGDGWRVRAVATSITSAVNITGLGGGTGHQQSYAVGYRYDKNNIVSWGEYAYLVSPDGSVTYTGQKYQERTNAGYVLGGYRIGDFLPRYTFSQVSARTGLSQFAQTKTTSHTLGLNYAVNEKVTLKGEYELTTLPFAQDGTFGVTTPTGSTRTSGNSVYFGADFEI